MPFFKWEELESGVITPKYSPVRGPIVQGERILMGYFTSLAGGKAELHAHPNEQIASVVKGLARIRIEKEEKVVGPGDVILIPANAEHMMETLEDFVSIACKDVVRNWSLKEARWEK